jgi:hypothetical protein
MVATPTPTATAAIPGRVSARHGQHAARAAAQSWRALDADHVRELRVWADADPRRYKSKLPRWHRQSAQRDLTTGQYAETGASWVWEYDPTTGRRQPVLKGSRGRVTWLSRERYLTTVLGLVLAQPGAQDVLKAHHVDADTFRRWVRHESLWADQRTGRRVIVRAVTVATLMEVDKRTVQRCRAAGRALGLYVTVYPGRMLTQREQVQARYNGSPQRGLAAESAFVVPRAIAGTGVMSCLHRGAAPGQNSNDRKSLVTVNTDGEMEATSSRLTNKRRRRASAGYKLARAVVEALPFARETHPSNLAGLLHRFATATPAWTAQDVVQHVNAVNERRGWSSVISPLELKRPAYALLASYLRDADPNADHPRLFEIEQAERRARHAAEGRRIAAEIRAGLRCCAHC